MLRMEAATNVRTMEFIGKDDWDRPVYKCLENGYLWKDLSLDGSNPELYSSSSNEFDGEPSSPISDALVVVFKTKYEESPYRFNYMMLSRMQSDCEYFLGHGNRNKSRLNGDSVEAHIITMKGLYDSFPEGHNGVADVRGNS
jgi:hypothetical protein